jgi:uncharacterized protein (TIGR03000 family)
MPRTFLAIVAALLLPLAASAQNKPRKTGFGGGFKPVGPSTWLVTPLPAIPPFPAITPPSAGLSGFSGGFVRPGHHHHGHHHHGHHGFPFFGIWPGYGGWGPNYGYPVEVPVPVPVYVPVGPPEPAVELSGEVPAVLVLQFPAAAEVWVNGKKGPDDPQSEWTLTSPPIQTGTEYTFDVKARWESNGTTYEHEKTVTVAAGNRSRSLVLSGTAIKQ